jgi:hypothetical protein
VEYIDQQIYIALKQKKAFGTIVLPALLFRFGDIIDYQLYRLAQTRYSAFGMQVINAHTLQWRWLTSQEWIMKELAARPTTIPYPEECLQRTHERCHHSPEECYVMATLRPIIQLTNPVETDEAVFFEFEPEVTQYLSTRQGQDLRDRIRTQFQQKYPHRYFTWKRKGYYANNADHHLVTWQFYSTPIVQNMPILKAGELDQWVEYCSSVYNALSFAAHPRGVAFDKMAKTSFPSNEPDIEKNASLLQIFIFIYAYIKFYCVPVSGTKEMVFSRPASFLLSLGLTQELSDGNYALLISMIVEHCNLADLNLQSINIQTRSDRCITLSWT